MPVGRRYGVEVRAAQPTDAAELARLLGAAGLPVPAPEVAVRLEALRAQPGSAILVATGYPGLVGVVSFCWSASLHTARPIAWVGALVVDPDERRRGIGRLLLKAASQVARSAGCDLLQMSGAEAFCLANGFVPAGPGFERPLRRRIGE